MSTIDHTTNDPASVQGDDYAQRTLRIAGRRKARGRGKFRSVAENRRLAGAVRVAAAIGTGTPTVVRLPITNIYDGSDYSAAISIGSAGAVANVILDTGSSTLAVDPAAYNGTGDTALKPTGYAQLVFYGTGGWAGPVVTTDLALNGAGGTVTLPGSFLAIASEQQPGNFEGVTGILGLAYNGLNTAYDFQAYLTAQHKPPVTYPWSLGTGSWRTFVPHFETLLKTSKAPQTNLTPYFDQLEDQGVIANKFAFYTLRSWVSLRGGSDHAALAADPRNNGVFVLGGGEEQTDLYTGDFVAVDVLHDLYYNTNLVSVQVGNAAAVPAAALQPQFSEAVSNSIVDSGTSDLSLAQDVYDAILAGLKAANAAFGPILDAAAQGQQGVDATTLDLAQWLAVRGPHIDAV